MNAHEKLMIGIIASMVGLILSFVIPVVIPNEGFCKSTGGVIVNSNLTTMTDNNRTLDCGSFKLIGNKWCEVCT
jgi:hypothetical protein